jgi:hypothetical protein
VEEKTCQKDLRRALAAMARLYRRRRAHIYARRGAGMKKKPAAGSGHHGPNDDQEW